MLYQVNRVAVVHNTVNQRKPFSLSCLFAYWAVLGWMDTVDGWMDDLDYEQTHGYGTFLPDLAWPGRACLVCWPATAEREKERQREGETFAVKVTSASGRVHFSCVALVLQYPYGRKKTAPLQQSPPPPNFHSILAVCSKTDLEQPSFAIFCHFPPL